MTEYTLRGIGPPFGKQQELIDYIFRPDPHVVKQVDLCCGRGFGKSVVAIDIAIRALCMDPNAVGLFLEPDWKRIYRVFLKKWTKIVPPGMYKLNKNEQLIRWFNGALLYYGPRNVTGSYGMAEDSQLGQDTTFIIDDEAALRCSRRMYANNLATIREQSPYRFYLTLSTPRVGAYKKLVTSPGHKIFRGHSDDNPYLPAGYVEQLKENMSADQVRRELYGEFVALEGRLWKSAKYDQSSPDCAWPNGNRHDDWYGFREGEPWWLFCDLGGATGAYVVVQRTEAYYRNARLFNGPVWVAVADLCPHSDASAARAFRILKENFGSPAGVTAGADMSTRTSGDGLTVAYFVRQTWGNVPIYPCDERFFNKQIQYDSLSFLMCSASGQRRFTIARDFVSLDENSRRGVREMIEEDIMPEENKRRASDFLPKNREITVQHVRDALMMGAAKIMHPPDWMYSGDQAA